MKKNLGLDLKYERGYQMIGGREDQIAIFNLDEQASRCAKFE